MNEDWLYSTDRLELREKCLSKLLMNYGSELDSKGVPIHSTKQIYNCVHDWVSQGHPDTSGILNYFIDYYT